MTADSTRRKTNAHQQAQAAERVQENAHREVPLAPAYLTLGATEVWYEVMNAVPRDHFEPGDYRALAAFCEACALYERMTNDADTEPYTVTDDKGNTKVNPFHTLYKNTAQTIQGFALRLKLAPSTRTKDDAGDKRARRMMHAGQNSRRAGLMFQPQRQERHGGSSEDDRSE